jgi:hypothetical protein
MKEIYWHVYVFPLGYIPYDLVSRTIPWRHAGDIDRYWYEYRVSRDAFRKHVWERGLWEGG